MAFMIRFIPVLLLVIQNEAVVEATIGINWGRQSAQRLVPSVVVDLILQNGISDVRFYTGREDVLHAFAGTDINLTIAIFDSAHINSSDIAKQWIKTKIQAFPNTNIRRVMIGDNPFYHGILNKGLAKSALTATMLLQNALNEMGYGERIKVSVAHPDVVLKDNITRPSDAEFRDEIKEEMKTLLHFLEDNDAPLVIEFVPIAFVAIYDLDPNFAYPDNKSTYVVTDINGLVYTNVFEFIYDAFVWAAKKADVPNVKIVVGQVAWPTDGYPGANLSTAERFYKSLLPMVISNKGTPMRPGKPIDTNIHALMDENRLPYFYPFARHWGIYRTNGEPKYKIDLTGQGRDIYPTRAAGITKMPGRWCVFNGKSESKEQLSRLFEGACEKSDCTCLSPSGSCSHLELAGNISYAFNMYFQFHFQDEEACKFEGLGKVVTDDPSNNGCIFPLEVVKGKQELRDNKAGCHSGPPISIFFLYFLSIFLALMV